MKWIDSLEKRLDSLELEADLSRRRILTSVALNLVTGIILVGVG